MVRSGAVANMPEANSLIVLNTAEVQNDEELSDLCNEQFSEASDDSFGSANEDLALVAIEGEAAGEDFLPYDQTLEPIATEEEAAEYDEQIAQEEEEEEILWSRFSGEEDVENWFVVFILMFTRRTSMERLYPLVYISIPDCLPQLLQLRRLSQVSAAVRGTMKVEDLTFLLGSEEK